MKHKFKKSSVYNVTKTVLPYKGPLGGQGFPADYRQMAGNESPRTTKLYDRTKDEITLSEVERIRL
jgi:hypothetical protein